MISFSTPATPAELDAFHRRVIGVRDLSRAGRVAAAAMLGLPDLSPPATACRPEARAARIASNANFLVSLAGGLTRESVAAHVADVTRRLSEAIDLFAASYGAAVASRLDELEVYSRAGHHSPDVIAASDIKSLGAFCVSDLGGAFFDQANGRRLLQFGCVLLDRLPPGHHLRAITEAVPSGDGRLLVLGGVDVAFVRTVDAVALTRGYKAARAEADRAIQAECERREQAAAAAERAAEGELGQLRRRLAALEALATGT